jgi:hypothetical protein
MMKTIYLQIAGTDSAVKHFLPMRDPCRIVGAKVTCNAAQAGAALITIGKDGASKTILDIDLQAAQTGDYVAGVVVNVPFTSDATDAHKNQIFGGDVPICITPNLTSEGSVCIELTVDPFLIGPHKGPST